VEPINDLGTRFSRVKNIIPLIVFLICYLIVLKKYDAISFFHVQRKAMLLEGALGIIIYFIVFITQKQGKLRYIKAVLPVLLLYISMDIYFKSFGTVFKFVAIYQLTELVRVADFYLILILSLFIVVIPIFLLISIDYNKWQRIVVAISLFFLLTYSVEWNQDLYLKLFYGVGSKIYPYSDQMSVESNGRLAALLYWEANRVKVTKDLENIRAKNINTYDINILRVGFKSVRLKRNVHLIVLESFFNPSLLSKIKFSRNPMHSNLLRYIGTKPAVSVSSVFGGRSAQAEFEILCGAPAFSDFSDIEFSIFGGKKTYCLPSLLSEIGYVTLATNSYRPDFFNSEVAYKGLGFSEIYFPKEYTSLKNTYFSHGDVGEEKYMFDGDLLNQNLNFYSNRKKNSRNAPIFNYVVSNYGHFPYTIDYNKRPKIVDIEVPPEFDKEPIERIVNQFYYRSQALGIFLDELKKLDPEAVVIIVGDHLPTLEPVEKIKYGYKAYGNLGYLVGVANPYRYSFLFIMSGGRKVSYDHVSQYNILEIILDCLTNGEYCSKNKCFLPREQYHDRYLNIMSQAVER
jgi:phosphoglycerol transferase MdoB-like AlkP superfamily enzyme